MDGLAKKGATLGQKVAEKNAAYGDSFFIAGDFLRLLYPNGVQPDQYDDMLCLVRIFDKLARIATAKDAFGESPYDDIAGYGILGSRKAELSKKQTDWGYVCRSDPSQKHCTMDCCVEEYAARKCACI